MGITECFKTHSSLLMEGALSERLKREFHLVLDDTVAMADFVLTPEGRAALETLWTGYIAIAKRYGLPFLATTPTRRANRERLQKAGYGEALLWENVRFLRGIQEKSGVEMYIGGLMGCKGDAYTGAGALSEKEAYEFHSWQADAFCKAGIDFFYAGIMPALPEAIGMAKAMGAAGVPYIISFTILRSGTLIDQTTISDAISAIDGAVSPKPLCYMANCVHPTILYDALAQPFNQNSLVKTRFLGIQGNTSPLSYEELDRAANLLSSNPRAFACDTLRLQSEMHLKIFGGCCGTDDRHIEEIAKGLSKEFSKNS